MLNSAAYSSGSDPEGQSMRPGGSSQEGLLGRVMRLIRDSGFAGGGETGAGSESVVDVLREHGESERPLTKEERMMLLNLLQFRSLRVDDVMVPRADIVAVDVEISFDALMGVFKKAGHSRLPIYRETLDDPMGMIHLKDVIACFVASAPEPSDAGGEPMPVLTCADAAPSLQRLRRDVLFVPPSMPAVDLLLQMQAQRVHMALVIDEYGGTDGLVTIEDLVEMIVGDIEDEHDHEAASQFELLDGGVYAVDARMEIEDFEATSGLDLRLEGGEEEEVDTLGGLVFTLAGRVPRRGEIINHPGGFDIEILEADPRRIRRLKVTPRGGRGKTDDAADDPADDPADDKETARD